MAGPFHERHATMDGVALMQRRQRLRRQDSLEEHRRNFDKIVEASMESIRATIEAAAGSALKDLSTGRDMALEMMMANFAQDLQRRLDRCSHKYIDSSWDKYDINKDGVLDKAEMRGLVKDVIVNIEVNLPRLAKESVEPAVESLKGWIEHDSTGPMGFAKGGTMHLAMEAQSHARVDEAAKKMTNLMLQIIQGLCKSSDQISDEIFAEIDVNEDNVVSKHEFYEGFGEAMSSVLDFSRIVTQIMKARSQQNKQGKGDGPGNAQTNLRNITDEDSLGGTLFKLGFGILALGMAYTVFTNRRNIHV